MDPMRLKLVENQEYLISDATDIVRMRVKRSYEGDAQTMVCERADVINAIFPPMKDVPFRRIKLKDGYRTELTSLVSQFDEGEQKKNYTITVPVTEDVTADDLLFRIMGVEPGKDPIVVILQVSEVTADFSHSRILIQKCGCTIPTEELPSEIIETMVECARRRKLLGF